MQQNKNLVDCWRDSNHQPYDNKEITQAHTSSMIIYKRWASAKKAPRGSLLNLTSFMFWCFAATFVHMLGDLQM